MGGPLGALALAFGFLTRLPVPTVDADVTAMARSSRLWPLAGVAVAVAGGLALALGSWGWSRPVGAVLAVGAMTLVTGGLHLDGLSDCVDGLLCKGDATRRLRAMRDPHAGGLGAAYVALWLLLKVALVLACAEAGTAAAALWAAAVLARAPLPFELREGTAATPGQGLYGTLQPAVTRVDAAVAGGLALVLLAPVAVPPDPAILARLAVGATAAVALSVAWHLLWHARLGGLTGDVLGAAVELREGAILAAMGVAAIG